MGAKIHPARTVSDGFIFAAMMAAGLGGWDGG
jgi:hypothetical protein